MLSERERFLQDPAGFEGAEPPAEWVAEGWRKPAFREYVTYTLARSIAKVGSSALAGQWLTWVSRALDPKQATGLYEDVREQSERLEYEWRGEFERAFPLTALPPSRDEDVLLQDLQEMIVTGAGQGFEHTLRTLQRVAPRSLALDPDRPDSLLALARERERTVMALLLVEATEGWKSGNGA